MTFSFRRNTDKGLPATHTVEINFKLPADFPFGGVSNVPGMLMKQAESTRGGPLAGLAVKITPGFYLIGLSNQEAEGWGGCARPPTFARYSVRYARRRPLSSSFI